MRGILLFLMMIAVACLGCAIQEIDSDFPSVYPDDEYFPLRHFEHLTNFEHLPEAIDLILTDAHESC